MAISLKKSSASGMKKILITVLLVGVVLAVLVAFGAIKLHKKAISGPIKPISESKTNMESSDKEVVRTKDVTDKVKSSEQTTTNVAPAGTGSNLISPYGALVSNHKPGQNNTSTLVQSECITTPGASCSMKFVQNGIVKTLPAQTTDSTGATFWTWDVEQAGLTSGAWQITATATLNGQTKSTTDKLSLEIQ